jgi:hypothetical protein
MLPFPPAKAFELTRKTAPAFIKAQNGLPALYKGRLSFNQRFTRVFHRGP